MGDVFYKQKGWHPLIKLLCAVTFVMAPLFMQDGSGTILVILATARMTRITTWPTI